jgi:RNA-directed DNA polymerase
VAKQRPGRKVHALYDRIYRSDVLEMAWNQVRRNQGAAGVDAQTIAALLRQRGVASFLEAIHHELRENAYQPQAVLRRTLPKADGKQRPLGIPTVRDRVVQAAAKLILEPIFETKFRDCSYGFRPGRSATQALEKIRVTVNRGFNHVLDADIRDYFDEIDHNALMSRMRHRVGDKHILRLVKAFLRAGILTEEGNDRTTITGTPQGGVLSPLLANIALSILDEHFARKWEALGPSWKRAKHRRGGAPTMRIVRYADDFVVMVKGTQDDAEALRHEVATVLAPMGLRLSEEKTKVAHIDEGFDFLGWRIQRRHRRGQNGKKAVYTYPSKKALASVMAKVRSLTARAKHRTLGDLLRSLNRVQQGWCNYFRHGVSSRTFSYLDHFSWWRVFGWLRKRHPGLNKGRFVRRRLPNWEMRDGSVELFRPQEVAITRYRYRGARIPTPWTSEAQESPASTAKHMESRMQ